MSKTIIDVREADEYQIDHADGAINIPLSLLMADTADLTHLSSDSELIVYCRSGNRSAMAMQLLKKKGFSKLVNGIDRDNVVEKHLS